MNDNLINALKDLIIKAGVMALDIKKSGIKIDHKLDGSPVTNADKEISTIIYNNLKLITPNIVVVCEERPLPVLSTNRFWLIDPIDGTKSYISGQDSYTINIGLIENGTPTMGLIYQPEFSKLYYTDKSGNLKIEQHFVELHFNQGLHKKDYKAVLGSHHNIDKETQNFLSQYPISEVQVISSSIKLCLIAEGKADIYPRFGQTMEWDTAAGHALIKATGGNILNFDGSEVSYGKEDFANHNFCAYSFDWLQSHRNL